MIYDKKADNTGKYIIHQMLELEDKIMNGEIERPVNPGKGCGRTTTYCLDCGLLLTNVHPKTKRCKTCSAIRTSEYNAANSRKYYDRTRGIK